MSAPMLGTLSRLPRWLVAVLMAALLVTGLALGGVAGAACLLVLALVLAWLLALSWPVISPPARLMRLLVVGAIVVVAVLEVSGVGGPTRS